jgi:hypothetical protein
MNNEERRIRQGGTLGKRGLILFGGNIFWGYWRRERGGGVETVYLFFCFYRLEDFHRGHPLLGILGSGARKP